MASCSIKKGVSGTCGLSDSGKKPTSTLSTSKLVVPKKNISSSSHTVDFDWLRCHTCKKWRPVHLGTKTKTWTCASPMDGGASVLGVEVSPEVTIWLVRNLPSAQMKLWETLRYFEDLSPAPKHICTYLNTLRDLICLFPAEEECVIQQRLGRKLTLQVQPSPECVLEQQEADEKLLQTLLSRRKQVQKTNKVAEGAQDFQIVKQTAAIQEYSKVCECLALYTQAEEQPETFALNEIQAYEKKPDSESLRMALALRWEQLLYVFQNLETLRSRLAFLKAQPGIKQASTLPSSTVSSTEVIPTEHVVLKVLSSQVTFVKGASVRAVLLACQQVQPLPKARLLNRLMPRYYSFLGVQGTVWPRSEPKVYYQIGSWAVELPRQYVILRSYIIEESDIASILAAWRIQTSGTGSPLDETLCTEILRRCLIDYALLPYILKGAFVDLCDLVGDEEKKSDLIITWLTQRYTPPLRRDLAQHLWQRFRDHWTNMTAEHKGTLLKRTFNLTVVQQTTSNARVAWWRMDPNISHLLKTLQVNAIPLVLPTLPEPALHPLPVPSSVPLAVPSSVPSAVPSSSVRPLMSNVRPRLKPLPRPRPK